MANGRHDVVITPKGTSISSSAGIGEGLRSLWQDLIRALHLVRLDLKKQVYGLTFGYIWHLLEPALQAATYYFLLTVVLGMTGADASFATFLLATVMWRSHSAMSVAAPQFLLTKGHQYVELGFGLNVASLEFVVQEVVLYLTRMSVTLLFFMALGYKPSLAWLLIVFYTIAMFAFSTALSMWLAIAGVFVKDLSRFTAHFVWLWWYMSPALYSFQRVPTWAKPVFYFNPFTYLFPGMMDAVLRGKVNQQALVGSAVVLAASVAVLAIGKKKFLNTAYRMPEYL